MSNSRIGASTCLVLAAILQGAGADLFQNAEMTIGAKGSAMMRRTESQQEQKTISESVAQLKSIQRSIDPAAALSQSTVHPGETSQSRHLDENLDGFERADHEHPHTHIGHGPHASGDHTGVPHHAQQQLQGHGQQQSQYHDQGYHEDEHHGQHEQHEQQGKHEHGEGDYYHYYEEPAAHENAEAVNWKSEPDKIVPLPHQLDNHIVFPPEIVAIKGEQKECIKTDKFTKMSAHCCSFKFNHLLGFDQDLEKMSYRQAFKYCEDQGHRLCSLGEVEAGLVRLPEEMDHPMWTSSGCEELHPVVLSNVTVQKETGPPPLEDIPTAAFLEEMRKSLEHLFGVQKESEDVVKNLRQDAEANGGKLLPFTMNSDTHDVVLEGWNLAIKSQDRRLGEGNLVVGLGHNIQKASNSFVAGEQNTAEGDSVTVAGGWMNKASSQFSSVLGGQHNTAAESYSSIIGGMSNKADAHGSVVIGGEQNTALGEASVIGGGYGNSGKGRFSSVSGGYMNKADGESSSVGGGSKNQAKGTGAAIGGGTDKISAAVNYR